MKVFSPDRITALREFHRLSPSAFAKKIGKTRQHVYNWEHRKDIPETDTLLKIAHAFNLSLDYFFIENEQQKSIQKKKGVA